jgi:hypothetical protein
MLTRAVGSVVARSADSAVLSSADNCDSSALRSVERLDAPLSPSSEPRLAASFDIVLALLGSAAPA